MDTSNPVYFIVDMMKEFANLLTQYELWGVSIWTWFIGFIFTGMVVSVFWRGARG